MRVLLLNQGMTYAIQTHHLLNNKLATYLAGLALVLGSLLPVKINPFASRPNLYKSFNELSPHVLAIQIIRGRLQIEKNSQDKFIATLFRLSKQHKFDPLLLIAIIEHESRFNNNAVGKVGERGLMQIRPETASWLAKKNKIYYRNENTLHDPIANLKIGVAYLVHLRTKYKQMDHYLAAYNLGPTKYMRLTRRGISPKIYYNKVFKIYSFYQPDAEAFVLLDVVGKLQHL